jgi:hypothetical protein
MQNGKHLIVHYHVCEGVLRPLFSVGALRKRGFYVCFNELPHIQRAVRPSQTAPLTQLGNMFFLPLQQTASICQVDQAVSRALEPDGFV